MQKGTDLGKNFFFSEEQIYEKDWIFNVFLLFHIYSKPFSMLFQIILFQSVRSKCAICAMKKYSILIKL